jgi:hypothetical protein
VDAHPCVPSFRGFEAAPNVTDGRHRLHPPGEVIAEPSLPGSIIPVTLDVLRRLADNERDLTRVVVEIIHDIRDGDEVEDALDGIVGGGGSVDSDEVESQAGDALGNALGRMKLGKDKAKASDPATAEEEEEAAFAKAVADVRCLHILRALLERISGVRRPASIGSSSATVLTLLEPNHAKTDAQRQLCATRPPARADRPSRSQQDARAA